MITEDANNAGAADSQAAPLVELRDLGVHFGSQQVLRGINLHIPRGQTLAIIGESGCGKTVLLKTIIGLVQPTEGRVSFDGDDLSLLNDRDLTRMRTRFGFLFQQAALFDSLSVGQNIAFPLRQHQQLGQEELRQKVLRLVDEVGLAQDVIAKKPAELSGGMRKRVGLARALAMEPEILLYDEPTTGLDPIVSDVINELILSTRRSHPITSVVVTHDMRTAQKVADRVVMIYPLARLGDHEQQIIFDGGPEELTETADERVRQFVRGEAGQRLREMGARLQADD